MFHFILGAIFVVLVYKLFRSDTRFWERGRSFFDIGGSGRGGEGEHGVRRWFARRLYRKLDTTPNQDKVLDAALQDLWARVKTLKETSRESRAHIANLLRGDSLNAADIDAAFTAPEARMHEIRDAFKVRLVEVFEALHPDQRRTLARLLDGQSPPRPDPEPRKPPPHGPGVFDI